MNADDSGRVYIDPEAVKQARELQIRKMLETKQITIEIIKKITKEYG